jgi:hypothetical protein
LDPIKNKQTVKKTFTMTTPKGNSYHEFVIDICLPLIGQDPVKENN